MEEEKLSVDELRDRDLFPTDEEMEDMHEEYLKDINHLIRFKCKPVFNFQSVEFEYECDLEHIPAMFEVYKAVLNELMTFAPEQNAKASAPVELATPKQREIMDKFHLKYKSNITRAEAQELIKKSIDAVNK